MPSCTSQRRMPSPAVLACHVVLVTAGLYLSAGAEESSVAPEDLWALQPVRPHAPPLPADGHWPEADLDCFILQRLEAAGLQPAPDAGRYDLLRRVTFDLTGLPPAPEEIEFFVRDSSERAYEELVERLLASPAFGDHWARHWFDLSCYADLADIQGNVLIRDAWRYRDYVIAAFNGDKPIDRFIREQIAGDLLPYDDAEQRREQIIATGYLAIGPWTLQNYIKGQLAADVVDHQIDRVGKTFLAMTLACARCHDHKFDPIPTRDYYAMAGIFHSTLTTRHDGPGVWSKIVETTLPRSAEEERQLVGDSQRIVELRERSEELKATLASLLSQLPRATTANVLTLEQGINDNAVGATYEVSFHSGPTVWAGASQHTTARDGLRISILRGDGSVLAHHLHEPGAWSAQPQAQTLHPAKFTYEGDGSGDVRLRITSATLGSQRFGGALGRLMISRAGASVFEEDFNGFQPGNTTGSQAHTRLTVYAGGSLPGWEGAGLNHTHAVDLGGGDIAVQFFGGTTVNGLESIKAVTEADKRAQAQAQAIDKEIAALAASIRQCEEKLAPQRALAVRDIASPGDSRLHERGDFRSLGESIPRGFLSAVPVATAYPIAPNRSGRAQLAQWLTDPGNPLTARVLVNRIWHHLFGQGLVRSVDYFGIHGERPSHPELLDYLARQFMHQDEWSLKKTIRRLVTSRTYRMAADHDAAAHAIDPDNRLRWRMARRRLPAESIRDAMLAASAQLDGARGGPSLGLDLPGNITGLGGNVNPPNWGGKISPKVKNRRSIYLPMKRQRPEGDLEILSTFDFPHPSEMTGARGQATVATQALFLMNSPFVKGQARALADRLLGEGAPADEGSRIARLHLLTVSRPSDEEQIEEARKFLAQCQGELVAAGESPSKARQEAWAQLCHAVLASNAFLFRE